MSTSPGDTVSLIGGTRCRVSVTPDFMGAIIGFRPASFCLSGNLELVGRISEA
jgi:hypothetical protein